MSEKKLSAGEKRLKNILESLADIVAIFDRQGNLRFVTPSVKRLLGYEVSAITGANGFDFIHEEDRSRVMASFSSALEMGQHEETFRFRQADGGYLWFEGVGSAMEGDGNAPGLIVACRNVTRRKGMEDELRASETRYRVLSSIIPDFAYSCTHGAGGGFVLDWATEGFEKVTEWRLADLLHKECWFMLCAHPEDIPVVTRQMKNLELNKINTEEFRICTKSGRVLWIRNNLQLVADEHAAAGLRLYGAVQDITEQKVAYEALYNSELKYRDIFNAVTDGILMMPLD